MNNRRKNNRTMYNRILLTFDRIIRLDYNRDENNVFLYYLQKHAYTSMTLPPLTL